MNTRVSVCIPAYRQPESLRRALESVLSQKSCDFEIVVTDDSGDASVETAIRRYTGDPRVHYFKNVERLGAVPNWNASIRYASGRVIKILHHDDWLAEDVSLSAMADPILQGNAPVIFSACRRMSKNGDELAEHHAQPSQIDELTRCPASLAFGNFIGAPSVSAFDGTFRTLGFDPRYTWLADVEFYMRLLRAAEGRFLYLDKPFVNITVDSPAQISRFYETNKIYSALENIRLWSAQGMLDHDRKRTQQHFQQIGSSLGGKEIVPAIRFARNLGSNKISWMLARGYIGRLLRP